jgi:hypothetical protein
MINRRIKTLALLCTVVPAVCPFGVLARSAPELQPPLASDFDLSRQNSQDDGARYRVRREGEGRRFSKDKLGPYLTFNPVSGGPTLEFGALGAGRKGTPGLAHVGVDWSF